MVLRADLRSAVGLLPEGREVHFLPDLLLQGHPVDLHPLPILQGAEDSIIDICLIRDSSFLNWSAGIVFQKLNKS